MTHDDFTSHLLQGGLSELDIAVGQLWWVSHADDPLLSGSEIGLLIQRAGGPKINVSRLKDKLKRDARVAAHGEKFRLNKRKQQLADEQFSRFSGPQKPANSGSVLDPEMFNNARKYVKEIVWQINASYDYALFDCSAVMCRRLFETLLIDSFDKQGRIEDIRVPGGDLLMLSGIIGVLKSQTSFNVGRQTKQVADKVKLLGDLSAHNRTYIARSADIDKIAHEFSAACMDLLHVSGQD